MKKHSNIPLIFLFLALMIKGQAQTLRLEIKTIVDSMAKDNMLKSSAVGYSGVRTKQWDNFEKLKKTATNKELMYLTTHKNEVVRCYSFQALAARKDKDIFPILLEHINDTAQVTTFQGCVISSQTVGDYFLDVVTPQYIDNDLYKLSQKQKTIIDSLLVFDKKIRIEAKYTLLNHLKPISKYYNRIREIARTEKSPVSILALSRYKNKNDIPTIKTLFENEKTEYYGIYSAREFSDSIFYPFLIKIFEREWLDTLYDYAKWRILYQALAKYPNQTTYKLFERTTKTKDDFRYQTLGKYLLIATTKYPNPIFEPLKRDMKLDKYHLDGVESELEIEK